MSGRAEDADATGGMLDDGRDEQPGSGQGAGSKKSVARRAWAWLRRKVAQVRWSRWGAGEMPWVLRISQTVEGATLMARVASSPWILR